MATHKNVCSFLASLHEKTESFVIDFSPPRLQITLAPLLIPLGACRKGGQLHLWLQKQVYHCLAALSWLVGPLTRNAPMRQSGAIGAWRLAAGSDNLLGDMEKRAMKDSQPLVDTSVEPPNLPIQRELCNPAVSMVAGFQDSSSPRVISLD